MLDLVFKLNFILVVAKVLVKKVIMCKAESYNKCEMNVEW